jgi:hypothetical protein
MYLGRTHDSKTAAKSLLGGSNELGKLLMQELPVGTPEVLARDA